MDPHPLYAGAIQKLTGITHRQLDHLTHHLDIETTGGYHRLWTPDVVRRIQAAVALAEANPFQARKKGISLSHWVVGLVMNGPAPEPTRWVALVDEQIMYVNHLSDLDPWASERVIVGVLPALWPDIPEDVKAEVLKGGRAENDMCHCPKHRRHVYCGTDDYQCSCLAPVS